MKWRWLFAAALLVPSAADAADYDCLLGKVYGLDSGETGAPVAGEIRFGSGQGDAPWRFTLRREEREVEIVWRDSPMQFSGKSALIPTSDDSYAGFFVGRGPCLFTETNCGTTLHFAEQPDGTLKIQLHPLALTSFPDGHGEPFVVYLSGTCQAKERK
jgi:hypothetical protein